MMEERGELFLLPSALRLAVRGPAPGSHVSRPCVRSVLCCSAFPLVPGLGSTGSATGRPALFVGFIATMPEFRLLWVVHQRPTAPHLPRLRTIRPQQGPMADPEISRFPAQGASVHARVSDHAGSDGRSQ